MDTLVQDWATGPFTVLFPCVYACQRQPLSSTDNDSKFMERLASVAQIIFMPPVQRDQSLSTR
ncbi:MAG: hypothetical protein HN416_12740 [Nitrospina sp.]|nr:hypothetical protein [Nitrospina sp.]